MYHEKAATEGILVQAEYRVAIHMQSSFIYLSIYIYIYIYIRK